jgi:protein tyrosine phosphatase
LWKLFRKVTQSSANKKRPILVHCSAGVGRTGTFIAMDHLLEQAKKQNGIDVYACVTSLRESRMHMVQSLDQYRFIHRAVLEAYTVGATNVSTREFMQNYATMRSKSSDDIFRDQIEMLNSISPPLTEEETGVARLPENSKKNRTEILPANRHMMFLKMPFNTRTDYINAVRVPVSNAIELKQK